MDFRLVLAVNLGKFTKNLVRLTGTGGTAAPGLASHKVDPSILAKLSTQLEKIILITGTNGKTTTTRILGNHLENLQISYVNNREGSNLERGLISSLVDQTSWQGTTEAKVGLFEIDEAALATVVPQLAPSVIVINNLLRDQLDRYGEVDNIKRLWEKTLVNLDENTTLVLNADDPSVAFLGKSSRCKVVYFGIEDKNVQLQEKPLAVDSIKCPVCLNDLKYDYYYLSHLGVYQCNKCDFARPKPSVFAKTIELGKKGSEFTLVDSSLSFELKINLSGLYNIYNCLASYAVLAAAGFDLDSFPLTLKSFKPVFGRGEFLEHEHRKIQLALAKNPSGFNEILRTFLADFEGVVLLVINDLIADGRDVSWLWDVEFEKLTGKKLKFITSGLRATDMALRLKYAGLKDIETVEDLGEAVEVGLSQIPQNDTLLIIPTYTAMLNLKKIFAAKGIGGEFWED